MRVPPSTHCSDDGTDKEEHKVNRCGNSNRRHANTDKQSKRTRRLQSTKWEQPRIRYPQPRHVGADPFEAQEIVSGCIFACGRLKLVSSIELAVN
jgi:hypothetical protein